MFQNNFNPCLRFMVVSDVHYKDGPCKERDRMEKALKLAYAACDSANNGYKALDALYVVGDFATSGSKEQMLSFKETLDNGVRSGTEVTLMMASHEFNPANGGEAAALEKFDSIFQMKPDCHKIINGFHFISLTTTNGCNFSEEKVNYAACELKKAREDCPKKPIFFFQHPHISDTVTGSINWGEDALYSTLMDYPQVIDFSGHSHAPINDPRSVYQKHFTSLGTGSMSYFELDEFDKIYGTVPPESSKCAQFLIIEADENGRVRVYPYDVITERFFNIIWEIDEPWNPKSFKYTDMRYKTADEPTFPTDFKIDFTDVNESGFTVSFPQASMKNEPVDDYKITVREASSKLIIKQSCIWSDYFLYDMPERLSLKIPGLKPQTEYSVTITAGSFWKTYNESKPFTVSTK